MFSPREALLAKEMALAKFKKMAGEDWRKSKLLHVISAFKKKNVLAIILFDSGAFLRVGR
jgi:hypothetical protein